MRILFLILFFLNLTLLHGADFKNAKSLREAMLNKEAQRWSAVPHNQGLILCKRLMDHPAVTYREPVKEEGKVAYIRNVPPVEMQQRIEDVAGIDPQAKQALIQYYPMALNKVLGGLSRQTGGNADMGMLLGVQGMDSFLSAAPTPAQIEAEREADKKKQLANLDEFFKTAKIVGADEVSGRPTYHLRSTSLGGAQKFDEGAKFEPQSAEVWIDKDELVQVKMKVVGKLTRDGQTRNMSLEHVSSDFIQVGPFFEPRLQVSRMAGVLSPKEQKEMEKAQAEMAKFKKQLDAMPPSQQAMIKQMMGSKMEQFEKMASSGALEMETKIDMAFVGGTVQYATTMAHYAGGLPISQLKQSGLPVSQMPKSFVTD